MQGLTAGAQQIATWGTGEIIVYAAALGFVVAGFMCYRLGSGLAAFFCVLVGTAIASGATGIARSVHQWFQTASVDVPSTAHATAHVVGSLLT